MLETSQSIRGGCSMDERDYDEESQEYDYYYFSELFYKEEECARASNIEGK